MIGIIISGAFLNWLESSAMATFFRQSLWMYPAVEIVHITSFSILVGTVVLFDLRLLGFSRSLPVTDCLRYVNVLARSSFLLILPSGLILFMGEATSLASNGAFLIKMLLIGLALVNAWIFHRTILKSANAWNVDVHPPLKAKFAGVLSILLWVSVISCGRLIAYI